jgi:membrane-associated phospholipid phosphatase
MRQSSRTAAESVLVVTLIILVPIAVVMFRQVRQGRWSNVDASRPSERPLLFGVAFAGLIAVLAWLLLNDPQSFLVRGVMIVTVFLLLSAVLTRWVKLSLHVAFLALTATALYLMGSWAGDALIALIPVMFWSRVTLGRHRPLELVVGLVLGVATGVALVRL